jgi:hypothetical protein
MNDVLLIIHFIGLMLGAAGGIASAVVMRMAAKAGPEQAGALRSLGPRLAKLSVAGLVLLWLSGITLVWSKWDGIGSLPGIFWVKLVFVLTLTAATAGIELTYAQIKSGNFAAAARLPMIGPAAGLSAFLAVIFAVFAFQ